jgi:hypothetical protein
MLYEADYWTRKKTDMYMKRSENTENRRGKLEIVRCQVWDRSTILMVIMNKDMLSKTFGLDGLDHE